MKVLFLYNDFGVPGIVHFPLVEVSAINEPPSTYAFYFVLLGKRSPWKNDFSPWKVLEKSLIFPQKFCMNHVKHIFFVFKRPENIIV